MWQNQGRPSTSFQASPSLAPGAKRAEWKVAGTRAMNSNETSSGNVTLQFFRWLSQASRRFTVLPSLPLNLRGKRGRCVNVGKVPTLGPRVHVTCYKDTSKYVEHTYEIHWDPANFEHSWETRQSPKPRRFICKEPHCRSWMLHFCQEDIAWDAPCK